MGLAELLVEFSGHFPAGGFEDGDGNDGGCDGADEGYEFGEFFADDAEGLFSGSVFDGVVGHVAGFGFAEVSAKYRCQADGHEGECADIGGDAHAGDGDDVADTGAGG